MAGYDAPVEVRELERIINSFSYQCGKDPSQIFDDFLTYIIYGFSPLEGPLESWKYKKEETAIFYQLYAEWARVMAEEIDKLGWYDAFGDLYMSCVAGKSKQQGTGQFFTPSHICDLMSELNNNNEKITGKYISDPTCGSGRTLLSWHARNIGNYLCAEDMDRTCCLMTLCNFLIHGCIGEVIWHNSLDPDSYYGGWKVNECLTNTGLPTIRRMKQHESFVWKAWQSKKLETMLENTEVRFEQPTPVIPKMKEKTITVKKLDSKKNVQLTLFDF